MSEQQLATKAPPSIRTHLESQAFREQVAMVLPKHLTPERFVRVALTATMRTPALAQADQASFFNALLTLSQLGLEPDGRRAHLIPFKNSKRNCVEVQLVIDYKGLVELAMRSGFVVSIHADKVCEHDHFVFNLGQIERHEINFRADRGESYAYYARAVMKEGPPVCEVMTVAEISAIRARSRAGDSGPWVTDFGEMAKKTTFRRLAKWLPLSSEFRDALDADADSLDEKRFESAKPAQLAQRPQFTPRMVQEFAQNLAPGPEVQPEPQPEPVAQPAATKRTRKPKPQLEPEPEPQPVAWSEEDSLPLGDERHDPADVLREKLFPESFTDDEFIREACAQEIIEKAVPMESLTSQDAGALLANFEGIAAGLRKGEGE